MAIAGSAVNAYRVWLEDGRLKMQSTTTQRELCDDKDYAVLLIEAGAVALVAGSDVDAVRMNFSRERVK